MNCIRPGESSPELLASSSPGHPSTSLGTAGQGCGVSPGLGASLRLPASSPPGPPASPRPPAPLRPPAPAAPGFRGSPVGLPRGREHLASGPLLVLPLLGPSSCHSPGLGARASLTPTWQSAVNGQNQSSAHLLQLSLSLEPGGQVGPSCLPVPRSLQLGTGPSPRPLPRGLSTHFRLHLNLSPMVVLAEDPDHWGSVGSCGRDSVLIPQTQISASVSPPW